LNTVPSLSEKSQKTIIPPPSSQNYNNKQSPKKSSGKNENNLKLDPKTATNKEKTKGCC
jgi:hypothetical protein